MHPVKFNFSSIICILNITTLKAFRNLVYLNNLQPFGLKSVVNWMMSSKSAIEKVIKEDEVVEIF